MADPQKICHESNLSGSTHIIGAVKKLRQVSENGTNRNLCSLDTNPSSGIKLTIAVSSNVVQKIRMNHPGFPEGCLVWVRPPYDNLKVLWAFSLRYSDYPIVAFRGQFSAE